MSFFNTFRGFGRSSKKTKASPVPTNLNGSSHSVAAPPANPVYRNGSASASSNSLASARASAAAGPRPLFLCQPYVRTALVKGSFQTIVMTPKYVDLNEWMALNVFEFFTYLNQFYGVIQEFVTPQAYPTMNAGPGHDYLWIDSNKKAVRLPANTYIDYSLTWISNKFDDQTLFPTNQGVPFPPHFLGVVKNIYRQMFRIFAHIYYHHFDKIVHLSLEAHWNSFFAHFISFGKTMDLLDRTEMAPMLPLIEAMEAQGKIATERQ